MLDGAGDERVAPTPAAARRTRRLIPAATFGLLTAVAAALGVSMLRPAPVTPEARLEINTPSTRKELFYIAADDRLMSVPMRFFANGDAVEAGTPQALFATNVGSTAPNTNRQQYAVSSDGQSFILNSQPDAAQTSPITVILNWKPER